MTGPIPWLPDFDPLDPYGRKKKALDLGFLSPLPSEPVGDTSILPKGPKRTLHKPASSAASGVGPRNGPAAQPLDTDFQKVLKAAGGSLDDALMNTPWFNALWMLTKGIGHEVGGVGEAIADRNVPGAGGREEIFNRALPLAAGLWPMGAGSKITDEAIEAIIAGAPKGVVTAMNEGERALSTDAAGYITTNRGRTIRPSAPPLPQSIASDAEIALGRPDAEGMVQTSRGRTVRTQKPLPRPNPVEKAAGPSQPAHPMSLEGTLAQEHGVFPHEGGRPIPGPGEPDQNKTRFVAENLIKEDAISRTKSLKEAGQNVEMQRQPDGTWSIRRKGESVKAPRTEVQELESQLTKKQNELEAARKEKMEAGRYNAVGEIADRARFEKATDDHMRVFDEANILSEKLVDAKSRQGLSEADAAALRAHKMNLRDYQDHLDEIDDVNDPRYGGERYNALVERVAGLKKEIAAIEAKKTPGTALARRPSNTPANLISAGESGFHSRLKSVVEYGGEKRMTVEEWRKHLAANPDVPKAELDAALGVKSPLTPAQRDDLETLREREGLVQDWMRQHPARTEGDMAHRARWDDRYHDLQAIRDEIKKIATKAETKGNPNALRVLDDYVGEDGKLSSADLTAFIEKHGPVSKLETTTLRTGELREVQPPARQRHAPHHHDDDRLVLTERVLDDEVEHLAREERDDWREQVSQSVRDSHENLQIAKRSLENLPGFGREGGKRWEEEIGTSIKFDLDGGSDPEDPNLWEGWASEDDIRGFDSDQRDAYLNAVENALEDAKKKLFGNSNQLLLGHDAAMDDFAALGGPPPLHVQSTIERRFESVMDHERDAVRYAEMLDNEEHDLDGLRERARENLEENGYRDEEHWDDADEDNFDDVGDDEPDEPELRRVKGNTEYMGHQRVNDNADYREILIHHPGSGVQSSHFSEGKDLVAHARGEIHGDTYLMIEAQSDAAKAIRKTQAGNRAYADEFGAHDEPRTPISTTQRAAQVSTGASLRQAAQEGLEYFAWVDPKNRMRRAHLAAESAEITYGQYVPEAVERIFRWLGLPIERSKGTIQQFYDGAAQGGVSFDRVRLTPEIRQRLLKAGIPALGLGAAVTVDKIKGRGQKTGPTN